MCDRKKLVYTSMIPLKEAGDVRADAQRGSARSNCATCDTVADTVAIRHGKQVSGTLRARYNANTNGLLTIS